MFSYARLGRSLRRNLQVSIFFLAQREKLLTLYLKKALASPFVQTGAAQLNQNKIEGEVNRSVPSLFSLRTHEIELGFCEPHHHATIALTQWENGKVLRHNTAAVFPV